ncbi:MAG: hypothetical protein AAFR81_09370 [Chloroflexota bacterium]
MSNKLLYAENDRFVRKIDSTLFNREEILNNLTENGKLVRTGNLPLQAVLLFCAIIFLGIVIVDLIIDYESTDSFFVFTTLIGGTLITTLILVRNLNNTISTLIRARDSGSTEEVYDQLIRDGQLLPAKVTKIKGKSIEFEFTLNDTITKKGYWTPLTERGHIIRGDSIYVLHFNNYIAVI